MTAFLLAAVAALVAVNGFFVGAEFALVRARRSRIEALARSGTRLTVPSHETDQGR